MGKVTRNLFIDKNFPNSLSEPFEITSPETAGYNCLAWALNDNSKWYDGEDDYYWFKGFDKNNKLETIQKIFEGFGFTKTENTDYQEGVERIALFSKDNIECAHLARQQNKVQWTSKLGSSYDVNHTLKGIENGIYGSVVIMMEKRLTTQKPE